MSNILKKYIIDELQNQTDSKVKKELLPQQTQLAQAIADAVSTYLKHDVSIDSPAKTIVGVGPPGSPHDHILPQSKLRVP